jgi:hypothetical protein
MRRVFFLAFAASLAVSAFTFAQTGSMADLRADEQRLHRQELQLDQDRDRLALDRTAMHRAYRSGLTRCRSNAIDWKSSS